MLKGPPMTPYERERRRHAKPVSITISTKVPSKWRFVDLETRNIWRWDEKKGRFKAVELATDSSFHLTRDGK
jgi:hypothetical protein